MARRKIRKDEGKTLGEEIGNISSKIPTNTKYIAAWVVGLVLLFIILNYAFPLIYKALGVGTINYQGLAFTKESIGTGKPIIIYHYYYLYRDSMGELVQNNIYLRNDPRTNTVPVTSPIEFFHGLPVYVGVDADSLSKCNQSSIAISELAAFVKNAGFNVHGGTINATEAESQNVTYVSCNNQTNSTVIQFVMGNMTGITRTSQICYKISTASCSDVLSASEKFIVQSIIDAKNADSKAGYQLVSNQ